MFKKISCTEDGFYNINWKQNTQGEEFYNCDENSQIIEEAKVSLSERAATVKKI